MRVPRPPRAAGLARGPRALDARAITRYPEQGPDFDAIRAEMNGAMRKRTARKARH
jgi:hypothetical protein